MEIFRQWGLAAEVAAAGLPLADTEYFLLAETLLADDYRRMGAADLGRSITASPTERVICSQNLAQTQWCPCCNGRWRPRRTVRRSRSAVRDRRRTARRRPVGGRVRP
jgi:hypothetical protein